MCLIAGLDSFDTGIQSLSWKKDGSQLAVLDNQPMLIALDPRNGVTGAMKANVSSIIPRDAHVLWLSSSHYILVSGLSKVRGKRCWRLLFAKLLILSFCLIGFFFYL